MGKTKASWVERPGGRQVGRFHVEFEVANYQDMVRAQNGDLQPAEIRRATIQGVVDSGAASLVLPQRVAEELGVPTKTKVRVKYANGRIGIRNKVSDVFVSMLGRDAVFTAVVEPKRETALIGAIILEELDFILDSKNERLIPRDPDFEMYEIE